MKFIKKTMFALAVLFAAMAVLVTGGCKKADFDINGNWYIDFSLETSGAFNVGFTGSKTSGDVIYADQFAGEYQVEDKNVVFVVRIQVVLDNITELFVYEFSGTFSDADHMSGTVIAYLANVPGSETQGTWSGQRL